MLTWHCSRRWGLPGSSLHLTFMPRCCTASRFTCPSHCPRWRSALFRGCLLNHSSVISETNTYRPAAAAVPCSWQSCKICHSNSSSIIPQRVSWNRKQPPGPLSWAVGPPALTCALRTSHSQSMNCAALTHFYLAHGCQVPGEYKLESLLVIRTTIPPWRSLLPQKTLHRSTTTERRTKSTQDRRLLHELEMVQT